MEHDYKMYWCRWFVDLWMSHHLLWEVQNSQLLMNRMTCKWIPGGQLDIQLCISPIAAGGTGQRWGFCQLHIRLLHVVHMCANSHPQFVLKKTVTKPLAEDWWTVKGKLLLLDQSFQIFPYQPFYRSFVVWGVHWNFMIYSLVTASISCIHFRLPSEDKEGHL